MGCKAGEKIEIAIEYYAGHSYKGCEPFSQDDLKTYEYEFCGIDICTKNYEIQDFYFDLYTLNQMVTVLPDSSPRRSDIINTLYEVHTCLFYSLEDC